MNNRSTRMIRCLIYAVAITLALCGPTLAGKGGKGGGMSDQGESMGRAWEKHKDKTSDDLNGDKFRERMEHEHQMREREHDPEDKMRKMEEKKEQYRERYENKEQKFDSDEDKLRGLQKQQQKKMEQEQKELGKGSEQGQTQRQENRRKWWKFWE